MATNELTFEKVAQSVGDAADTLGEVIEGAKRAIEIIAVGGVKEHFDTSTDPDGRLWPKLLGQRPDGGNSDKPLLDKGLLRNATTGQWSGQDLMLMCGHVAANVHQFGATIKPKKKLLAIPLTPEAKRIGSPRKNKFPRPLFFLKTESGAMFLCESNGNGGVTIQYVLKRSVKIPARPFLGYSEKTLRKIEGILANRMMQKLGEGFDPRSTKLTREQVVR